MSIRQIFLGNFYIMKVFDVLNADFYGYMHKKTPKEFIFRGFIAAIGLEPMT